MRSYNALLSLLLSVLLSSCASFDPIQVSSGAWPLHFDVSAYELEDRVRTSLGAKGWDILYDDVVKPTRKISRLSNSSPFSSTNWDDVA